MRRPCELHVHRRSYGLNNVGYRWLILPSQKSALGDLAVVEGVARRLESVTARRIVRYLASGTVIVLLDGNVKLAPGLVRQVSGTKFMNIKCATYTSIQLLYAL